MSALGAPRVLLTRARRDSRSPTVASRFWLRLQAMTGGLTARPAARAAGAGARRPGATSSPSTRPAPRPPLDAAPEADRGDRARPAEGRSLRLLRQGDPQLARARSGRCRPHRGVEGHRGPRGARALVQGGRLRSGQARAARAERLLADEAHPPDAPRPVAAAADRGDRLDRGAKSRADRDAGRTPDRRGS